LICSTALDRIKKMPLAFFDSVQWISVALL
jgi:hypothetical protein